MDHLSLEVVYDDEHLIQVECRVVVGSWAGTARAYTTPDDLRAFAGAAGDFAESLREPVEWEAGNDNGIGLIRLRLYTVDRAGHVRCHVRLASEAPTTGRPEEIRRFAVELPTESGLVAAFARQLGRVAEELRGQAVLAGTLA
jgi:hypothetical protein